MNLQEARKAYVDPNLIRGMREEWGLSLETSGILDTVDLKSGKNDALLLDSLGIGSIVVVEEEPQFQGFGNQIVSMLARGNSELHDVVKNRDIYLIGSKDMPFPPCDGILMNAVIPTTQSIQNFILRLTT